MVCRTGRGRFALNSNPTRPVTGWVQNQTRLGWGKMSTHGSGCNFYPYPWASPCSKGCPGEYWSTRLRSFLATSTGVQGASPIHSPLAQLEYEDCMPSSRLLASSY